MLKKIHIIINPAAGQDEPILSYLNQSFWNTGIDWDVSITKKDGDAKKIAKRLVGKTDAIAVYGGDGSVMEVAQALYKKATPMAIIPGGTANVMAKELSIPTDTLSAIELLKSPDIAVKTIDMGLVNNKPFILRINMGVLADMVTQADRELKHSLGQLAYGITAIQTLLHSNPIHFQMNIDGKKVSETGVALAVSNSGNIGIEGFSFLPDISVSDGLLDVILITQADLFSMIKMAGTTLFQTDSTVMKRWKGENITIKTKESLSVICDDVVLETKKMSIKVVPNSLNILVPPHTVN